MYKLIFFLLFFLNIHILTAEKNYLSPSSWFIPNRIPQTSFGRDGHTLKNIVELLLSRNTDGTPIAFLSVGASIGAEGFDMAIYADQYMTKKGTRVPIDINITDLRADLIRFAQNGGPFSSIDIFHPWRFRIPVSYRDLDIYEFIQYLLIYFTPIHDETYHFFNIDQLKKMGIEFGFHPMDATSKESIQAATQGKKYDFICARNVHVPNHQKLSSSILLAQQLTPTGLMQMRYSLHLPWGYTLPMTDNPTLNEATCMLLNKNEIENIESLWQNYTPFDKIDDDFLDAMHFMLAKKTAENLIKLYQSDQKDQAIHYLNICTVIPAQEILSKASFLFWLMETNPELAMEMLHQIPIFDSLDSIKKDLSTYLKPEYQSKINTFLEHYEKNHPKPDQEIHISPVNINSGDILWQDMNGFPPQGIVIHPPAAFIPTSKSKIIFKDAHDKILGYSDIPYEMLEMVTTIFPDSLKNRSPQVTKIEYSEDQPEISEIADLILSDLSQSIETDNIYTLVKNLLQHPILNRYRGTIFNQIIYSFQDKLSETRSDLDDGSLNFYVNIQLYYDLLGQAA